MTLATSLYAVFVAYPFVLGSRARESRDPYLTAIGGSVFFFFAARIALLQGGLSSIVGIVPVVEGIVLALLLRALLRIEPRGGRDLARLAIVAGSALAFATVAIPLQLEQQWITIGWALEGAALAWLYRRIPHRGLLYCGDRAAVGRLRPARAESRDLHLRAARHARVQLVSLRVSDLQRRDPRGGMVAVAHRRSPARRSATGPRRPRCCPPAGVILLFILLNIEIADFYATGPEITFRFGVTHRAGSDLHDRLADLRTGAAGGRDLPAQSAGPHGRRRADRDHDVQGVPLRHGIARRPVSQVASLVGLAISLSLVALALQKFVLQAPKEGS